MSPSAAAAAITSTIAITFVDISTRTPGPKKEGVGISCGHYNKSPQLRGLRSHRFTISGLEVTSVEWVSPGVGRGGSYKVSGEDSVSLRFPPSRGTCLPWLPAPLCTFKPVGASL